jgi:hypothetical protein
MNLPSHYKWHIGKFKKRHCQNKHFQMMPIHHKFYGPRFGNNSNVKLFFSYRINTYVIHLLVLLEHWCHVHYLNKNFILCLFILFGHKCCIFIRVFYKRKFCTRLLCLGVNEITRATFTYFLIAFVTTFRKIF